MVEVNILIQAGGDVNEQTEYYGSTTLHAASENGHVEVVERLIQAGGELNRGDKWGDTPLHNASMYGHVEVITALLAAGADKTIEDWIDCYGCDGMKTPYDYAKNQDCRNAL